MIGHRRKARLNWFLRHMAGGLRAYVSGKQILGPGDLVTTWRGTNQGNWGDNYEPDAAVIKSLGANVVRTLIRWQGTTYPAGTDSYNASAANDYLDPANYAQFLQELDWLEAQGLWIIVAFDTDNGAGNRGLGTADWNFFDTTDTAGKAQYTAEFKQAWRRIARDCRSRQRVLCYEPLPEPMPTGSNAGHAAPLRDFYTDVIAAIQQEDANTPFLIGPRASYGANFLAEALLPRSDCIYTIDILTSKVEDEATVAAVVEGLAAFRDANTVPVLVQQVGRETADDEGQGSTSDNSGLTALNGVLACLNAHGIPYTHWQFHQNSTNPIAYSLYYKIDAGENSADNWAPKAGEIEAFTYHMGQTGADIEAAAVAAATACNGELFYVKGDLSNAYQTNDTSTPVTALAQTVGRLNAVVGSLNLSQSTAGSRPTLAAGVNGYAMQFDGAGDWLSLSSTYFASGDDCTVIAACRPPAGSTNRVIFHVGNSSTTVRNPYVAVLATDELQVSWRGDDAVLTGSATTTGCDNRAIVASGTKVGNDKSVCLQGVQEGTPDATAVGSAASITRARLGGTATATNLFTGPIALLFVCKTTVTAEQRRAIERWGAWLVGAPFRGAIPDAVQTWANTQTIGLNSPVPKSYNPTRPYRNLAHQARMIDNFTNNGMPDQKADGYPAAGEECYVIFAEDTLGAAYDGNYAFAVDGDNVPSYCSTGSLSASYNSGTGRTTGTITGVDGSQNLILGWSGGAVVDGNFGDLQLMQPGYSIDDPELFTPEFLAHAGRAECFRTMDLQDINYNTDVTWTGSTAAGEGVFLKHTRSVAGCFEMIDALGCKPWLCITPDADDDYIENMVGDALVRVAPGHVMRLGYGNEPWNTGLQTYGVSLRRALAAGDAFTGNTSLSQAGRRITSVSRTGTTVTVELSAGHGMSPGQMIYSHCDAGGVIAHGVYTLAAGTTGLTLVFNTAASGSRTGTLDVNGFGSFVYLNLSNPLAAPYTGYGNNDGQDDYPPILAMKVHHEIQRLRVAYDKAVEIDMAAKLALVRDTYGLLHRVDQLGLARARQQYGDLDWLYANGGGLTYNYYLTPASPDGVTTADEMLTQLEASRAQLGEFTLKAINAQARFAGDSLTPGQQSVYEWGLHNHDVQNSTVGAVVQTVHRDDARTSTLLANAAKDMVDRGINLACYFTCGTDKDYAAVTQVGASWGLHEGAMAAPSSQVKDAFFTALRNQSAEPESLDGLTWGTIRLADVHELLYQPNDDLFTNGVEYLSSAYSGDPDDKAVVLDIDHRLPDPVYHVYVETAGPKTIALDACAWFTVGATIAMEIDGVEVDSAPIQQVDYNTTAPPEQLSATLTLTKGWHRVRIVLPAAPRGNYVALYRLRCS